MKAIESGNRHRFVDRSGLGGMFWHATSLEGISEGDL